MIGPKLEKFEKEIISLLNYYNGNISKINKEIFKKKLIYAFKYFYEELKIKIELNNSNIDKFIETFNEILKLKYNNYFVDLGTILEIYYEITNNNSNIELLNLKGYKLKNKINNIAYYFKYNDNKLFSFIYNINFYSLPLTEKYKLLDNITKIIIDTDNITLEELNNIIKYFFNIKENIIKDDINLKKIIFSHVLDFPLDNLPPGLIELECGVNNLTRLDNLPPTLQKLYCSNNQITHLNNLPKTLQDLICKNNLFTYDFEPTLKNIRNYNVSKLNDARI